jgi:hypothetical protein
VRLCPALLALSMIAGLGRAQVVINEIMYHPGPSGGTEFIELFNPGDQNVDLSAWQLRDAVRFTFEPGTVLGAGGLLVVAKDPTLLSGVSALGPWDGHLSNRAERIELVDALSTVVDSVRYADDGPWPSAADGDGPSLELMNPALPNEYAESWAASPLGSTPGSQNASYTAAPPPFAEEIMQTPLVPTSTQSVNITGRVFSLSGSARAVLHWRRDGETEFHTVAMTKGSGPDMMEMAIPAQPDGTVVEYHLEVTDASGQTRIQPGTAPEVNDLIEFDDDPPSASMPIFRLIMTRANWDELRARDPYSNDLLPAAVVTDTQVFQGVGLRYRGSNNRVEVPEKSYRVNLPDAEPLDGVTRHLNLNGHNPVSQFLAMDFFARVGVLAPRIDLVGIVADGQFLMPYAQVEELDEAFLDRVLGRHDAPLYQCEETADLNDRGTDPAAYADYKAVTDEADHTDIVSLVQAFNAPGDDDAFAPAIGAQIDVDEWLRFFAANACLSNQEGSIYRDTGDDYYLVHDPASDRLLIIPWDMDSTYLVPEETVFRPTLPAIVRLLHHPDFARRYEELVLAYLKSEFSPETTEARVALLPPEIPADVGQRRVGFARARGRTVTAEIPSSLRGGGVGASSDPVWALEENQNRRLIVNPGSRWRYLRGTDEPPAGWREPGFDDSSWGKAILPIGAGDLPNSTPLADMPNSYSTLNIRAAFDLPEPGRTAQILLTVDFDDGFIAYLNGTEVARANVTGTPDHTGVADGPHTPGKPAEIRLNQFIPLLQAGENILAITGFNAALADSDFTLDATLRLTERPKFGLIEGANPTVTIGGVAPLPAARTVSAHGQSVPVDAVTGSWQATIDSAAGLNTVEAIALDAAGQPLERATVRWVYAPEVMEFNGTLAPNRTIVAPTQHVIRVTGPADLPASSTLVFTPGTIVAFDPFTTLLCYGRMEASGTPEQPVIFMPAVPGVPWGSVAFAPGSPGAHLSQAKFLMGSTGHVDAWNLAATLDSLSSTVELRNCSFIFGVGKGVVMNGSPGFVRSCYFHNIPEGVNVAGALALIDDTVFTDAALGSPKDPIDVDNSPGPPIYIRNNLIINSEDDGIDLDTLTGVICGNTIIGITDKGISVGGGAPEIRENVIVNTGTGIALKDGADVTLMNNTLVGNGVGVDLYQNRWGWGGAIGNLESSVIWGWATAPLQLDSLSSATVNRSNIEGGSPISGVGNLDMPPDFMDPDQLNYHLAPTSPLRHAGLDSSDIGALDAEPARFDGFVGY